MKAQPQQVFIFSGTYRQAQETEISILSSIVCIPEHKLTGGDIQYVSIAPSANAAQSQHQMSPRGIALHTRLHTRYIPVTYHQSVPSPWVGLKTGPRGLDRPSNKVSDPARGGFVGFPAAAPAGPACLRFVAGFSCACNSLARKFASSTLRVRCECSSRLRVAGFGPQALVCHTARGRSVCR